MRKHIFVVLIPLLALWLSACDLPSILSGEEQSTNNDRNNSSTDNLLMVDINGGIAGVSQRLTVSENGRASFVDYSRANAKWTIELSDAELNDLVKLMLDNNFFGLNDQYIDPQVADAFIYAIKFTNNNQDKTVVTDYFGAPDNLKRIVDAIQTLVTRVTQNGLEFKLEVSRAQNSSAGKVDLKLTATNVTDRTLNLRFPTGQIFEFYAYQPVVETRPGFGVGDSLVWNWAHDKAFIQMISTLPLPAGESLSYQVTWDGRDNSGTALSGQVVLGAELLSTPGGSPPYQVFNLDAMISNQSNQ
jgi:hypothetical protein